MAPSGPSLDDMANGQPLQIHGSDPLELSLIEPESKSKCNTHGGEAHTPHMVSSNRLTPSISHVVLILDEVTEHLLQSGSPYPYEFEDEALDYSHDRLKRSDAIKAGKDLTNMCLVHSSWLASAQRVLQRRLFIHSPGTLSGLLNGKSLGWHTTTLHVEVLLSDWRVGPLIDLLGRIPGLRLLHTNFRKLAYDEGSLSADISALIAVIVKLEGLEGLILSDIPAEVSCELLKPLFFSVHVLKELRYMGIGHGQLTFRIENSTIFTLSANELAEYRNPPKLNTVVFWIHRVGIPIHFLDYMDNREDSLDSGPDIFEIKRPVFAYPAVQMSILVTKFVELLKARRLFVVGEHDRRVYSPLIEDFFVKFISEEEFSAGEQVYRLIEKGVLPRLRFAKVSSKFGEETQEFQRARELCMSKGCTLQACIRGTGDEGYIDDILYRARLRDNPNS